MSKNVHGIHFNPSVFQLIGCAVIDLSPSGNFENSQRISRAGIGEADDAPSSRHGASRSGRCNVLATLPRLNEAGGSGDTRARSLEMRRSAGMANGSQSALKSLTSGGRLAALEVTGFGSGALVAGTSRRSTHPMGGPGAVVIVIDSRMPRGRRFRVTAICCEPSASADG